jgi:hypothetical protein
LLHMDLILDVAPHSNIVLIYLLLLYNGGAH